MDDDMDLPELNFNYARRGCCCQNGSYHYTLVIAIHTTVMRATVMREGRIRMPLGQKGFWVKLLWR